MSFNISHIANSFLNVRNKVKNADGEWVDQTISTETQHMATNLRVPISTDSEHVVFNRLGTKIILDSLSYSTDNAIYPLLWMQDSSSDYLYQLFHVLTSGGGRANATPATIQNNGSDFLEIGVRENLDATVYLKRPIILPEGGKLAFRAITSGDVTYRAFWREIKE